MPSARALLRIGAICTAVAPAALLIALTAGLSACGSESSTTTVSLSPTLSPHTRALNWGEGREQLFSEILEFEVGAWRQPNWPKSWGDFGDGELLASGRAKYIQNCADCHGLTGLGDGPHAGELQPAPRDFSLGVLKYKSTPGTQQPLASDLHKYLTRPLADRPTNSCQGLIDDQQDLTEYIEYLLIRYALERTVANALNLLPAFTQSTDAVEQETQILQAMQLASTAMVNQILEGSDDTVNAAPANGDVDRGGELYISAKAACATCHGHDGAGKGPQTWEPALGGWVLKDMWGKPAVPGDFTRRPWRSGDTATDLARSIRVGIGGTPMPAYQSILSEAEIADLVAYILTLSE